MKPDGDGERADDVEGEAEWPENDHAREYENHNVDYESYDDVELFLEFEAEKCRAVVVDCAVLLHL